MGVDGGEFKAVMGRFASGVTVLTVATPDGDHGMTASAFCSLSLDPPLVLVCVAKKNLTHALLQAASGFGVNLLSADQVSVSNRFAGFWPEGQSKWDDLELTRGAASGAPLIGGALASVDCALHAVHDGGDHSIFVGRVDAVQLASGDKDDQRPLLYFSGSYRAAGDKIPF